MPYKDPARQLEYQRLWMAARRAEFFKDKHCAECGFTDELELDHLDPTQKVSHRIWSWSLARREAEIAKCQVLCHDCHQAKTITQMPITHGHKAYRHGTSSMYKHHGCKCGMCLLGARNAQRRTRANADSDRRPSLAVN